MESIENNSNLCRVYAQNEFHCSIYLHFRNEHIRILHQIFAVNADFIQIREASVVYNSQFRGFLTEIKESLFLSLMKFCLCCKYFRFA